MNTIVGNEFRPPVQGGAPAEAPSQDLGSEEFLSLLMVQMSNQDPLNPAKAEEFMNQITAMNSLQQQISMNSKLDELVLALGSLNNETAVNLVGRTVVAAGNLVQHEAGATEQLQFSIPAQADSVTVTVRDEDGEIVHQMERSDVGAGDNSVGWDGTIQTPNPAADHDPTAPQYLYEEAPAGTYTFEVEATGTDGEPLPVTTYMTGVVEELRFDSGAPQVVVGGQTIDLAAITRVLDTLTHQLATAAYGGNSESSSAADQTTATSPSAPPAGGETTESNSTEAARAASETTVTLSETQAQAGTGLGS